MRKIVIVVESRIKILLDESCLVQDRRQMYSKLSPSTSLSQISIHGKMSESITNNSSGEAGWLLQNFYDDETVSELNFFSERYTLYNQNKLPVSHFWQYNVFKSRSWTFFVIFSSANYIRQADVNKKVFPMRDFLHLFENFSDIFSRLISQMRCGRGFREVSVPILKKSWSFTMSDHLSRNTHLRSRLLVTLRSKKIWVNFLPCKNF